jgi:hypothetical protein
MSEYLATDRDEYEEHDNDKSDRWQRLDDEEAREQDEVDRKRAHAE